MSNGQTSGTYDPDLVNWSPNGRWAVPAGAGSDHRLAFNGWRQLSDTKVTGSTPASGANVLFSDVVTAMAKMGEYAATDCAMVVSPSFLIKNLLGMTQLATIDKFGDRASVLVGTQIGALLGMPVILSRFMTEDLNGSGKYNGISTDYTGYIIFNRNSYVQYLRRGLEIESQKTIASGSYEIVASLRSVMGSADATSATNCAYQYSIDS